MKIRTDERADEPPMTRRERAQLVDRVVRECLRDREFAHLLADNLAAAGVALPKAGQVKRSTRGNWSDAQLVRLIANYQALRLTGLSATDAHTQLGETFTPGVVVEPRHIANKLSQARKALDREDFGPFLRNLIWPPAA